MGCHREAPSRERHPACEESWKLQMEGHISAALNYGFAWGSGKTSWLCINNEGTEKQSVRKVLWILRVMISVLVTRRVSKKKKTSGLTLCLLNQNLQELNPQIWIREHKTKNMEVPYFDHLQISHSERINEYTPGSWSHSLFKPIPIWILYKFPFAKVTWGLHFTNTSDNVNSSSTMAFFHSGCA